MRNYKEKFFRMKKITPEGKSNIHNVMGFGNGIYVGNYKINFKKVIDCLKRK